MTEPVKPMFADAREAALPLDGTELVDAHEGECAAGGHRLVRDGGTSCFCGEITEESGNERGAD